MVKDSSPSSATDTSHDNPKTPIVKESAFGNKQFKSRSLISSEINLPHILRTEV